MAKKQAKKENSKNHPVASMELTVPEFMPKNKKEAVKKYGKPNNKNFTRKVISSLVCALCSVSAELVMMIVLVVMGIA